MSGRSEEEDGARLLARADRGINDTGLFATAREVNGGWR